MRLMHGCWCTKADARMLMNRCWCTKADARMLHILSWCHDRAFSSIFVLFHKVGEKLVIVADCLLFCYYLWWWQRQQYICLWLPSYKMKVCKGQKFPLSVAQLWFVSKLLTNIPGTGHKYTKSQTNNYTNMQMHKYV